MLSFPNLAVQSVSKQQPFNFSQNIHCGLLVASRENGKLVCTLLELVINPRANMNAAPGSEATADISTF